MAQASRLVDICLDAGLNMFDSADVYSGGMAEEILGQAIEGPPRPGAHLHEGQLPRGTGPERRRLVAPPPHAGAVESSLRRLGTDYIDLYQLHGFDALTPVEEVLRTLDDLVRAGKIRYIGCSNFSGWHLMKSLATSDRYGLTALRGASGLLLAHRPRLRVGADAARRSTRRWAPSCGARSAGDA